MASIAHNELVKNETYCWKKHYGTHTIRKGATEIHTLHYDGITRASRSVKSPTTRLLIQQQLIQDHSTENIKAPHNLPFVRESMGTTGFPLQRVRNVEKFPCPIQIQILYCIAFRPKASTSVHSSKAHKQIQSIKIQQSTTKINMAAIHIGKRHDICIYLIDALYCSSWS